MVGKQSSARPRLYREKSLLRTILLARREELIQSLRQLSGDSEEAVNLTAEEREITEAQEFVANRFSDLETQELRRVEAALARLDTATYGTCLSCAGQIRRARLRAIPWAELCLDCEQRRMWQSAAFVARDASAREMDSLSPLRAMARETRTRQARWNAACSS